MSDVRITAVVPNYNHGKLLPRSLGALLEQPVPAFEILVIDDASTDDSLKVLEPFTRKHSVLRVVRNEKNQGVLASLNRGLELARGDYVLFPAADDEVRPGLFAHATRQLSEYPDAGVFSGQCEVENTVTGLRWLARSGMPGRPGYLAPAEMVALAKRGRLAIYNQHAVFKKSALVEAGGWRSELQWFTDWFGAYVVGLRYGMCYVPEVLSTFYLYPTSFYNSDAGAHAKRRVVMQTLLGLLESPACVDVLPRIREAGLLGEFAPSMLRVMAGRRRHWQFFTPAFARHAARRTAEVYGQRYFPTWLARWCLRLFYGLRKPAKR